MQLGSVQINVSVAFVSTGRFCPVAFASTARFCPVAFVSTARFCPDKMFQ